ncbi:MAG: hypothetical protein ABIX28_14715 [Vicinamibacterales bacterium]
MTRMMTAVCCAGVLGIAAASAAQSDGMKKMEMGKDMMVTGCVAQDSADMSHFMLKNAMMAGADGMKKDSMAKPADTKPMSYMLMGGDLKAHVGHKVEVTGSMADKMMAKDSMSKDGMAKDSMAKDGMAKPMAMPTLNVKSVKMLAATCS